jgi:hypothetical protein
MLSEEEKARNRENYRHKMKKQNKKTVLIILAIPVALVVLRFIWGMIAVNMLYSHGERKVQIVKIATRGFGWKSYEIEGIIAPGKGISTTYVWDFSLDNRNPRKEELFAKLNQAFEEGKTVRIKYDQMGGSVPWRSATTYWATDVEEIQ